MTNTTKSAIYATLAAGWIGALLWLDGNDSVPGLFFLCSLAFFVVFAGAKCALDTLWRVE